MFALVLFTVVIQNMETKQYEVRTKPIGLYATQKACNEALSVIEAGVPPDQDAKCLRAGYR